MKKPTFFLVVLLLCLSLCSCAPSAEEVAAENYQQATELLHSGSYSEALVLLRELGDYQDAPSLRQAAAYALTREYIKANGTPYAIHEIMSYGTFSHAIQEPVQTASESDGMINNYNRFISIDKNDQIVMGLSQYVQNEVAIMLWSFQITLPEVGNIANNTYVSADIVVLGDRSMSARSQGSQDLDISTYTQDSDLDMSYDCETTNYLGEVTTESKTISWAKQQHVLDAINDIPLDCQTLLESIGVTLADLGFAALEETPTQEEASS